MARNETIQKVTAALMSQLLPVDGLRAIVDRKPPRRIELEELLAHQDDHDFIVNAYQRIFDRDPEPGGIENWLGNLRNKKLSRVELIAQLVSSDEGKSRGVVVSGLGQYNANTLEGRGNFWKGIRSRGNAKSLRADNLDLEIKNIESEVRELAAQCLHVMEHIEHRFSKFPIPSSAELESQVVTQGNVSREVDDSKNQDNLRLLHQGIWNRQNQLVSAEMQLTVKAIHDMERGLDCTDGREGGWLIAGQHVIDLVMACRNERIPIQCALTSFACVSFLEYSGVNAREYLFDGSLPTFEHFSIPVVWLRKQLATQSDDSLLKTICELANVVAKNGFIVIEEMLSETAYAWARIHAAMEILGWEQVDSNDHQAFKSSLKSSESRIFLFTKSKIKKVHE